MIQRKRVVAKVVELMDALGELQSQSIANYHDQAKFKDIEREIFVKAIIVDHLMWVLDLGHPEIPGAALVREEHARYQQEQENG